VTLDEIIGIEGGARSRLDDTKEPYLWSDAELTRYAVQAEHEACRRADLITERTNPTYCRLVIIPEVNEYAMHEKVIRPLKAFRGPSLRAASRFAWNGTTRTLTDSSSEFVSAGFKIGDGMTVQGFATAGNNGYFTVSSVLSGSIVVGETGMVTEAAGINVVSIKGPQYEVVKTTRAELNAYFKTWNQRRGDPRSFLSETEGELVLIPIPMYASVLDMVVSRFPTTDMSDPTDEPEIPEKYHFDLIDWICHLSYLKRDADTFNQASADFFEKQFEKTFGPRPSAWTEKDRKTKPYPRQMRAREFGF
jgi:hypothetical protein